MLLDLLHHHRQPNKPGKGYMRVENTLLVFESDEQKELFVEAEEQAKQAINRAARRKVIATQPKPVIVDLKAVDQELLAQQQYQRVIEIYLLQLEEDDIEALLFI